MGLHTVGTLVVVDLEVEVLLFVAVIGLHDEAQDFIEHSAANDVVYVRHERSGAGAACKVHLVDAGSDVAGRIGGEFQGFDDCIVHGFIRTDRVWVLNAMCYAFWFTGHSEMTMKIGLIADTHMPGSIKELWPQVFDAFAGVDCILHAGDLHTLDVVDRLSELAPTFVAAGNGDVGLEDERLRDTWLIERGNVQIGMIHRFPSPARKSGEHLDRYVTRHFGEAMPQVMVFGHTHMAGIHHVNDLLCINPGSPTLPQNQSLRHGTVGMLEIADDNITASILQIVEAGVTPHEEIAPYSMQLAYHL